MENARTFLGSTKGFAMLIDNKCMVSEANEVANAFGVKDSPHCYGLGKRTSPCPWCQTGACARSGEPKATCKRVVLDDVEVFKESETGGFRFDAHHFPIDNSDLILHFGLIGLLPDEDREASLELLRGMVDIPEANMEAINQTVNELPNNEYNPMR